MNARSLLPKISDLRRVTQESKLAVLAISETWLDGSITDDEIGIDGYSVIRNDRNRNGGGVCIYVSNLIAHNKREDIVCRTLETVWIDLLLPKMRPITVATCYRPPRKNVNDSINELQQVLSNIAVDSETYLLGDFNINCNNVHSVASRTYLDVLSLFNFHQLINVPTRITPTTCSTLDHILCNVKENIYQSGTLNIGISDHMAIYCSRKIKRGIMIANNVVTIRSMKNYDKSVYVSMLESSNWARVFEETNVNSAWKIFKDTLELIIDNITPVKTVKVRSKTESWMTGELLEMIRERDNLFQKYKRERTDVNAYRAYCKQRNLVQRCVKSAKSEYFANQIAINKSQPRKLWSHLKNLCYCNKPKDKSNIVLNVNEKLS